MTREQKLALILGFALTLVVGVLISDHLSGARAAKTPELTDALTPSNLPAPGMGRDTAGYMIVERTPPTIESTHAMDNRRDDHADTSPSLVYEPNTRDSTRFAQALDDFIKGDVELPEAAKVDSVTMGQPIENVEDRTDTLIRDPLNNSSRQTTAPKNPSRETVHRIREGDTLWKIAEQYYNDGSQWQRILERNRDRVMPNGQVRAGASIVIPGVPAAPSNVQRPPATRPATYTVQKGDTLGEISMKTLGTSRRWLEILELNKDRIDDPDLVPVGVELRLPAH